MKPLLQILTAWALLFSVASAQVEPPPEEALPDPGVALWLMGGTGDQIVQGWPAILTVDLLPADQSALQLATRGANSASLAWPWKPATVVPPPERRSRSWLLSAADTAALQLGDVSVSITAPSLPVSKTSTLKVHVVAAPAAMTPEQRADQAECEIAYARLSGDAAGALAAADRWLAAAPKEPEALLAKSRTLLALDRPEEALDAANRALAGLPGLANAPEPPTSFLRVYNQAMDAVLAKNPPPAADPASADENQYYRLLAQGDLWQRQGDRAQARASYQNALQWLDQKKLPLDRSEVTQRLQKLGATPAPASRGTTEGAGTAVRLPAPILPASPDDAEFSRDPHGQWATAAEASSEYGTKNYNARQATGAPNVPHYGDYGEAWASKTPDGREEWLKLTFATPVRATAVRVRQTYNPGAISKIEAFAADGRTAVVWSGKDPTAYAKNQIAWFTATFEPPPFSVQTIKLTLDSVKVKGWNEIDAVQLVGAP
jgi:tetratricopeptide (TPR) repeat protein